MDNGLKNFFQEIKSKEILHETKPNEAMLHETKPNETKLNEIKPNETRLHETKLKENEKRVILAIDDMLFNLRHVNLVLEGSFEVRLAKSGNVALSILEKEKIDLILLDIEMPGMSGFDFLQRFKDKFGTQEMPPVIFLTSHGTPELIAEAKKAGATNYILKPFEPIHLQQVIHDVLFPPQD